MKQLIPALDTKKLQDAINDAARKGAIKAFDDYYNGYDSPYKKAIKEDLSKKDASIFFTLPDIVGLINDKLSAEIDMMANKAIAETLIPQVKEALTRREPIVLFSDILKSAIEDIYEAKYEDCQCIVNKDESHGWLNVSIETKERCYDFTLHEDRETKKANPNNHLYWIASLARTGKSSGRYEEMEISLGEAKIKVPFTTGALQDKVQQYLASIIISGSKIQMDVEEFEEEMFESCHCH